MRDRILLVFLIFLFYEVFPLYAQSEQIEEKTIQLITPEEGSKIVAKKPLIKFKVTGVTFKSLIVTLDGVDVTGILKITHEGFELKPIEVLPPGKHAIEVILTTKNGKQIQRKFNFSTRHSEIFEEAYSKNELSTVYETVIKKPSDANVSHSKIYSNLQSNTTLKEKVWKLSFTTNLRFLDQSLAVYPPEKKGINLANYLLTGEYNNNKNQVILELGDIQINETQNTVQALSRRGGKAFFKFNNLSLNTFVVKSEQVFGFQGGLGIEGTIDDHIMGFSTALNLFSDKITLKGIYVKGGEEEANYFGTSSVNGRKKGEVFGVFLKTELFEEKLTAEGEIDFSTFDSDTSDEFASETDKAYKFRIRGYTGNYSYETVYEYTGPEYDVIGNQGLPKDKEGFILRTGANFRFHSINLSLSRYHDNVKGNKLYPRIYTYQGIIDYTFNKIKNLTIGMNYQKSIIDSTNEPQNTSPMRTDTDMVSGTINYQKEKLNLGLQISHSIQNDKTATNNDTSTTTYTFTPTYTIEHLSISPNISFNRTVYKSTGVRSDNFTLSFDLRGDLFNKKISYELGSTFNKMKSSDNTIDQNTLDTNFRIAYLIKKNMWGLMKPSIGIKGTYKRTEDELTNDKDDELILLLVLTTSMPFSF